MFMVPQYSIKVFSGNFIFKISIACERRLNDISITSVCHLSCAPTKQAANVQLHTKHFFTSNINEVSHVCQSINLYSVIQSNESNQGTKSKIKTQENFSGEFFLSSAHAFNSLTRTWERKQGEKRKQNKFAKRKVKANTGRPVWVFNFTSLKIIYFSQLPLPFLLNCL